MGLRNAGELITLGSVDRSSDCLTRLDGLKHFRSEAGALIVDIDALKRERLTICQ